MSSQSSQSTSQGVPEIDPRDIILKEVIGRGSFGIVWRGVCRGEPVAVKVVQNQEGKFDEQTLAAFRREVEIVSRVFSPHVALYMGACTHDPTRLMIVTELLKTDLEKLLLDPNARSQLNMYRRMLIARDAALGLAWLHGSDPIFIHRDVKPSNFLLDEQFRCKITDFGLSQIRQRGESLIDRGGAVGTPLYMAPEVMDGAPFTEKSDVYSFGLVLWALLSNQPPFGELEQLSNDSFADSVCSGHRPEIPADSPPPLRRLITECWADEPADRPTASIVSDALEDIVLQVAVLDRAARRFWQRSFSSRVEVSWSDAAPALLAGFGADDEKRAAHIRTLLASTRDRGNVEVVSLEWFGRVCDWFGPIDAGAARRAMYKTLDEPWFHGDVPTTDAQRLLASQPIGAYLVRFSNQARGFFTITRRAENRAIHHQRINHNPMSSEYRIFDSVYASLGELLEDQKQNLNLTTPCPGSRFYAANQQQLVDGYLGEGDLTQSQEFTLQNTPIGEPKLQTL